ATSADGSRTRPRIRHDLLPRLKAEYSPAVAQALVRLGAISGAADRERRHRTRARLRATLREFGPDRITLSRQRLAVLSPFSRAEVVRLAWRKAGWPQRGMRAEHWEASARVPRRRVGHGGGA